MLSIKRSQPCSQVNRVQTSICIAKHCKRYHIYIWLNFFKWDIKILLEFKRLRVLHLSTLSRIDFLITQINE